MTGPNEVPSASDRPTPASDSCAATTAAVPASATSQAAGTSRREIAGTSCVTTAPKSAAPSSATRPRYISHRPAISAGVGPAEEVDAPTPPPGTDAGGGATPPTPNANEPAATWPSTAETVRQATV